MQLWHHKQMHNSIAALIKTALAKPSFKIIADKRYSHHDIAEQVKNYQNLLERSQFKSIIIASQIHVDAICLIYASILNNLTLALIDINSSSEYLFTQLEEIEADALVMPKNFTVSSVGLSDEFDVQDFDKSFNCIKNHKLRTRCYLPGLIFATSGSFSESKMVFHDFQTIFDYLKWGAERFDFSDNTNFLMTSSLRFIAALRPLLMGIERGRTTVLISPSIQHSPFDFVQYIEDKNIRVLSFTPTFLEKVLDGISQDNEIFKTVTTILLSGEKIKPQLVEKVYSALGNRIKVFGLYGATEVIIPFCYEVDLSASDQSHRLGESRFDDGYEMRQNEDGEYLAFFKKGIARSYLNTEHNKNGFLFKKTTRLFEVDDFFAIESGNLIIKSRRQHIVQHYGVKIDLNQISSVITSIEHVKDVRVLYDSELKLLSAHVCFNYCFPSKLNKKHYLKSKLNGLLPLNLHPQQFLFWSDFPLLSSGKTDYSALVDASEHLEPEELPEILCLFSKIGEFKPDTRFNELGFSSIDLLFLSSLLEKKFNKRIDFKNLSNNPFVKDFEDFLISISNNASKCKVKTANKRIPLTHPQKIMVWFAQNIGEPTVWSYNHIFKFKQKVVLKRLKHAIHDTVKSHFMLNCHMVKNQHGEFSEFQDATSTRNWLGKLMQDFSKDSFLSIYDAPLYQIRAFNELGENFIHIKFHHIIMDGWSMWYVLNEILCRYHNLNYQPSLSKQDEFELLNDLAILRPQLIGKPVSLSLIGYKFYDETCRVGFYSKYLTPNYRNKHFSVPLNKINDFAKDNALTRFTHNTIVFLYIYHILQPFLIGQFFVLLSSFSRRGLPLGQLKDLVGLCANVYPMILPVSTDLALVGDVFENDSQKIFEFSCSKSYVPLIKDDERAYSLFRTISDFLAYTYVDLSNFDPLLIEDHIDFSSSHMAFNDSDYDGAFCRIYKLKTQFLFCFTTKFNSEINEQIFSKFNYETSEA